MAADPKLGIWQATKFNAIQIVSHKIKALPAPEKQLTDNAK